MIIKEWVSNLGLRHQGVLLAGVRGCDISPREASDKVLARMYRGLILNAHCGDITKSRSFMMPFVRTEAQEVMRAIAREHDHLPHHYLMHMVHSWEIIGYHHPDEEIRTVAHVFYVLMCHKFHMKIEAREELDRRLNADEETFGNAQ